MTSRGAYLNGNHGGGGLLHAAVVGNDAEDVVVRSLVIEGLGVANGALVIDDEGLVGRQDLIFADVTEFGGAVAIRRLDSHHFLIEATFVHGAHVGRLQKLRGVLVDVHYGDVYGGTKNKSENSVKKKLLDIEKFNLSTSPVIGFRYFYHID